MVDEFSTRLRELLDYLHLTPVSLAEKMGVQRTSFNHLLSGRNKPGFEFLTRLHSSYPSINLNWLINGYGPMLTNDEYNFSEPEKYESESQSGIDLFSNIFNSPHIQTEPVKEVTEPAPALQPQPVLPTNTHQKEEEIDRLIIIYKSGKMVELKQ